MVCQSLHRKWFLLFLGPVPIEILLINILICLLHMYLYPSNSFIKQKLYYIYISIYSDSWYCDITLLQ